MAQKLKVRGMPVTVFIDRNGRISKKHIGSISYEELAGNIRPLLK